ncbi:hypothetical protein E2C01_003808 [Portunus trituberculatus]|uniref:Uncharacterized protein n=1 Tax=Portunus trituberculatus TaxID=210409 RepID=A0A5B7CNN8_PORTR|nr:hypothetical protein [Portunus trituberculatus]
MTKVARPREYMTKAYTRLGKAGHDVRQQEHIQVAEAHHLVEESSSNSLPPRSQQDLAPLEEKEAKR